MLEEAHRAGDSLHGWRQQRLRVNDYPLVLSIYYSMFGFQRIGDLALA